MIQSFAADENLLAKLIETLVFERPDESPLLEVLEPEQGKAPRPEEAATMMAFGDAHRPLEQYQIRWSRFAIPSRCNGSRFQAGANSPEANALQGRKRRRS